MSNTNIKSSKISFIIQGPPKKIHYYRKSLQSLLYFFPNAEIIISNSNSEEVHAYLAKYTSLELKNLKFISYPDPGPTDISDGKTINLSRQIIGMQYGLDVVERDYVCRLRPEIYFKSQKIFEYLSAFEKSLGTTNILASSITTKNPLTSPTHFKLHVSDWFFFAKTSDLKDIYFIDEEINHEIFENKFSLPLSTESYLTVMYLIKKQHIKDYEISDLSKIDCLKTILKHFIIKDPNEIGIEIQHWPYKFPFGNNGYLSLRGCLYDYHLKKIFNEEPIIPSTKNLNVLKFESLLYKYIRRPLIKILIKLKQGIQFAINIKF